MINVYRKDSRRRRVVANPDDAPSPQDGFTRLHAIRPVLRMPEHEKPAIRRVVHKQTPATFLAQQESSASSAVCIGGLHPRYRKLGDMTWGVNARLSQAVDSRPPAPRRQRRPVTCWTRRDRSTASAGIRRNVVEDEAAGALPAPGASAPPEPEHTLPVGPAAEVLRINPKFSLHAFAAFVPIGMKADLDRLVMALRKAGLPE